MGLMNKRRTEEKPSRDKRSGGHPLHPRATRVHISKEEISRFVKFFIISSTFADCNLEE